MQTNFIGYKDPINLFHDITNDHKTLEYVKCNQKAFKIGQKI